MEPKSAPLVTMLGLTGIFTDISESYKTKSNATSRMAGTSSNSSMFQNHLLTRILNPGNLKALRDKAGLEQTCRVPSEIVDVIQRVIGVFSIFLGS